MRFNNTNHRSLNESIARVQNPQVALDEALEYTAALEAVILSICEELEIDPDALIEDLMTTGRQREMERKIRQQGKRTSAAVKKAEAALPGGKKARSATSRRFQKEFEKSQALGKQYDKEAKSHKIYGKGGKVLKRIKTSPSRDARDISGRGYQGWSDKF